MDRETLRQMMLANARQVMGLPIVWNHMSTEQKKLTQASLAVDGRNDPTVNAYLDLLVQAYNNVEEGK